MNLARLTQHLAETRSQARLWTERAAILEVQLNEAREAQLRAEGAMQLADILIREEQERKRGKGAA